MPDKKIICLTASQDTLIADGKSTIRLQACIPTTADDEITSVTFSAPQDAGSFEFEGGSTEVNKSLDQTRTATAIFKSGRKRGYYNLTATVTVDSKSYTDNFILFEEALSEDVIVIENAEAGQDMIADNSSIYTWNIAIREIDTEGKSLTITNSGPFNFFTDPMQTEQSLSLDEQGKVSFDMQTSRTPGNVGLVLGIDNFRLPLNYVVGFSLPDKIDITTSKDSLNTINDSIPIKIFLDRDQGKVSADIPITLEAFQNAKRIVGAPSFLRTEINETNTPNASIIFSPQTPLDTLFELELVCTIMGKDSVELSRKLFFPVKK